MEKRWVVSWGFDSGKVYYYYTDRPLRDDEAEMSEMDDLANVSSHFSGRAMAEVESGKRKSLSLQPDDISLRDVDTAIARFAGV